MVALNPLPGGTHSVAFDINNVGMIVGGSELLSNAAKPVVHAVLWRGTTPQNLGAIDRNGNSIAYAINNLGDVVGVSEVRKERTVFLYSQGEMHDLDIRGRAFAINDQRQIVGALDLEERGRPRGFIWNSGKVRDSHSVN